MDDPVEVEGPRLIDELHSELNVLQSEQDGVGPFTFSILLQSVAISSEE